MARHRNAFRLVDASGRFPKLDEPEHAGAASEAVRHLPDAFEVPAPQQRLDPVRLLVRRGDEALPQGGHAILVQAHGRKARARSASVIGSNGLAITPRPPSFSSAATS